jgi:methanobactin biosynthesis MbnP-like protein
MKIFRLLIFTGIVAMIMSCDKAQPIPPNLDPELQLEFNFKVAGLPLFYQQNYINANGQGYFFDRIRFYVSKIELVGSNTESLDSIVITPGPGNTSFNLGRVKPGTFNSIRFKIGLDAVTNHSDPTQYKSNSPLSNNHPDFAHWNVQDGYQFIKLVGKADTSVTKKGIVDGDMVYLVGADPLLRTVQLKKQFTIQNGVDHTLEIEVDFASLMNSLDFRLEAVSQNPGSNVLALKIADKFPLLFSIK